MFRRRSPPEEAAAGEQQPEIHPEPRVFLIDMPAECEAVLRSLGFNVSAGTFGQPYPCDPRQITICDLNFSLGGLGESDIVVVDLGERAVKRAKEAPQPREYQRAVEWCHFAPTQQNYFNPRHYTATLFTDEFQSVLRANGVIVVFAGPKRTERYYRAKRGTGGGLYNESDREISNYDWLPYWVAGEAVSGDQVYAGREAKFTAFEGLLSTFLASAYYERVFSLRSVDTQFAVNRHGECVGFISGWEQGRLVVLPQFADLTAVCKYLFESSLPELGPHLFPYIEAESWTNEPRYQLPQVAQLYEQKTQLEEEHVRQLANSEKEIEETRASVRHLDKICTAQGDELVENLAMVLGELDFDDVEICDAEDRLKEEDIRLEDGDWMAVVETKGLSARPQDKDCQQVHKYLRRRQRDIERTDIAGIFTVNHQRNLEPLKREAVPFTQEQIDDAKLNYISLATTWDLRRAMFKLRRGILKDTDIRWSLRQMGLIRFLPAGSRLAGEVTHYYDEICVAAIVLQEGELKLGDEVAFYRDEFLFKQAVESLQVDNNPVEQVTAGDEFGLKVDQPLKSRDVVYLIAEQ